MISSCVKFAISETLITGCISSLSLTDEKSTLVPDVSVTCLSIGDEGDALTTIEVLFLNKMPISCLCFKFMISETLVAGSMLLLSLGGDIEICVFAYSELSPSCFASSLLLIETCTGFLSSVRRLVGAIVLDIIKLFCSCSFLSAMSFSKEDMIPLCVVSPHVAFTYFSIFSPLPSISSLTGNAGACISSLLPHVTLVLPLPSIS
mmetsp:Transcript_64363/g.75474  ORF Transcript_64363/g.75474 Transcript_64363/m.75474 type:complete len:205 (+) Transcript_64363:228-842(+)